MIRVIAVDDEPLALRQLESYIAKVPFFSLVASCSSAIEAMAVLEDSVVDAMFLDINMPDLSGLDFARSLSAAPMIVFTTAYSEYAVEGFKVDAVDYLLKPFSLGDFMKAAEKLKARYVLLAAAASPAAAPAVSSAPADDSLFFRTDYKSVKVKLDDIRYVEGMSEYIKVYVKWSLTPLVVLLGMKHLMEKLPLERFMRIHRSYIIPLACLKEVGKNEVVLEDGTVLPVGDIYRQDLKDYLSKHSFE
ncbi:MAG: response regulator transcription factor [Bacteroidales bacterium]|nr:response regulator transcription factor [Bacteroidales bacterium]